jgi:hypothetical protein
LEFHVRASALQTATLLPNGKILIAGGEDSYGNPFASAELYDPVSGTWTLTASLNDGRAYHTTTLLPTGQVLAALLATFKKASEEFSEGKVAEMDGGEVEAGDVEMAVAEGGMDAPASPAAGAASADLAMPAPTTTAPPGNVRTARADKDFAGWVS